MVLGKHITTPKMFATGREILVRMVLLPMICAGSANNVQFLRLQYLYLSTEPRTPGHESRNFLKFFADSSIICPDCKSSLEEHGSMTVIVMDSMGIT